MVNNAINNAQNTANDFMITNSSTIYLAVALVFFIVLSLFLIVKLLSGKKDDKKKKSGAGKPKQVGGKLKGRDKKVLKGLRDATDLCPYDDIYDNNVMKLEDGSFSKAYYLSDANFDTASEVDQEDILNAFAEIIHQIPENVIMQQVVYKRSISMEEAEKNVLITPKADNLNPIRDTYNNDILKKKLREGNNTLRTERYLVLTVRKKTVVEANKVFDRLENEFNTFLIKAMPEGLTKMTLTERLSIIHDIFNMNSGIKFGAKPCYDGHLVDTTDLLWWNKQGLTSKDAICAHEGVSNAPAHLCMNLDNYSCSIYLNKMPDGITPEVVNKISEYPANILISVFYESERVDKAIKMFRQHLTNLNSEVASQQMKAAQDGISPELVSLPLRINKEKGEEALHRMMSENEKVIYLSMVITVFAESEEKLKEALDNIKQMVSNFDLGVSRLLYKQKTGLMSSMPFGYKQVPEDTLQFVPSAAAFHPFKCIDIMKNGGYWYGNNKTTKNMVIENRITGVNYNAVVFGESGSGKSLTCKNEQLQTRLNRPQDTIYVIDPDRDYYKLAKSTDGQVVRIANGSSTHINPLDMDLMYAQSEDSDEVDVKSAMELKVAYLESLVEVMLGEGFPLYPIHRSLIARCGTKIYQGYIDHMMPLLEKGITIDYAAMPTLHDFYEALMDEPELESKELATAIEPFCTGIKDLFSYHTNIDVKSSYAVFDIKDVPQGTKDLSIFVCTNFVWNKAIENASTAKMIRAGKMDESYKRTTHLRKDSRTWIYIDEFYLLCYKESTQRFMMELWKRARKWDCHMTAITQNLGDLTKSIETTAILQNSNLLIFLTMRSIDREIATSLYNLSQNQLDYIAKPMKGHSILVWGEKTIVELDSAFPEESEIFQMLNTNSTKEKTKLDKPA